MLIPATPKDETERVAELCLLDVLDTPAEERFDRITRTAQSLFAVPIALISLVDQERQWFKSRQGLGAEQTPRSVSFCGHAILGEGVFVIEDADADPRFMDNPLVTDAPFVKFYAGVPLRGPQGHKLGTLCLIDHVARKIKAADLEGLRDLAAWAEAELAAGYLARIAKTNQSQLTTILDHTVDSIFTVDATNLISTANQAAQHMFDYDEKALVGCDINALMSAPQCKQQGVIQYQRQHAGKEPGKVDREMTGTRSNGTLFSIEVIVSDEIIMVDFRPCHIVIVREISALKLAKKKLRESSLLLKTVMDSTKSYIHVRDVQGRYLYVNKEYEDVFQCRNEDIIGKNYADVLPPELARVVQDSERKIIDTGITLHTENIVPRHDGDHTFMVIRSPLVDETGNIVGTCGVGLDITQNKRLEKEKEEALASLRISEERWAFALESSGEAVWDCDVPSGKVQLSERWKEMLGYADHEISDDVTEWSNRLHPDDIKRVFATTQETMEGKTPHFSEEYRLRCKNGNYLWILDRGMVVQRDAKGHPLRMVGTHTDITQRKQLELVKTEFISTVSHELRTPLTSIRGSLGLIEAGVLGALPPKALDLVKVAHKNSQRLITLVNDLLDMDKLLSGKMAMRADPLDMTELITQAIAANAAYAATYQVSFIMSAPAAKAIAIGDADRLMQVLANLMSNAAKFSRTGGVVDVRLSPFSDAGTFLKVEVEDHGEGIPLEFQPRLFQAFSQADSANTRRQGSTGLGLNISKKLIEQMGGQIGYTTEPGRGTTFWFTVPVAIH